MSQSLLGELRRVHDMLRGDLVAMRGMAAAVADGAAGAEVRAGLSSLSSRGLVFQLKSRCLGYCNLVHLHHGGEDRMLFPAVQRDAPHLGVELERLIKDHRVVSDQLDVIEAAAHGLDDTDSGGRRRLVAGLDELSEFLTDHLDREEALLAPVLNSWERWPFDV